MDTKESSHREKVVLTGGCHDCGGRCVHRVHVKDGVIVRFETDDGEYPQYRSCLRGRAYRQKVYDPDRLKYPMKRVGARGEGKFVPISWDEALDTVAGELRRVKEAYGPSAILFVSGTGSPGYLHSYMPVERLLYQFGGCRVRWGSHSAEGSRFASNVTYGTVFAGHSLEDLLNSRLIILWAFNPAVVISGNNTSLYLAQAREAGARIISVDPRFTESVAVFAHQWIPIRPGTDAAMLIAMAYVMIKENRHDRRFLDTYTTGFDKFQEYVMGHEDGVAKTPSWAENITGVPAATIENLAREYAGIKPAALITSPGPGRSAYGEQYHRAASTLAAMTGNIGIHGGYPAGHSPIGAARRLPVGRNPVESGMPANLLEGFDSALKSRFRVHVTKIWDALIRGKAGGYPDDFKLLYIATTNCLNSLLNTNRAVNAMQSPEFIVVHEQCMNATARFADILLPINTHMERNDIYRPNHGSFYIYANKAIDSLYESKSDFEVAVELASRLGVSDIGDKTEDEWLREMAKSISAIPDYDEFKRNGIHRWQPARPVVAFEAQIENPVNNPFPTPSGKIEIYSQALADLNNLELPPIPKYIEAWECHQDPLVKKFPLQLITPHSKRRANSVHDNIPWLRELKPQVVMMSTADAKVRGIRDGEPVKVFNDRGKMIIPAWVTERIMPGVVAIEEGAWYQPDEDGVDRGGCANVLTNDRPSPGGAFPCNTALVQIEKAQR